MRADGVPRRRGRSADRHGNHCPHHRLFRRGVLHPELELPVGLIGNLYIATKKPRCLHLGFLQRILIWN